MFSTLINKYTLATFVAGVSIFIIQIAFTFSSPIYKAKIDSTLYVQLLNNIKRHQDSVSTNYHTASTDEKKQLRIDAGQYLINTWYNQIVPHWIGTPWEFYGKTQVPQRGAIACGYFVSTTLSQMNIKLNRIDMAEGYSAWMVNSLCDSSYKFHKAQKLLEFIKSKPDDIWIVGLSNHTGMIVKYNGRIRFVHSSYIDPVAVVDEPAETSAALNNSTIYVAGHLFVNNSLTEKWITNTSIQLIKKF